MNKRRTLNRIHFGGEHHLVRIDATCPWCGVRHGEYHCHGCPNEECPACGRSVIACRCNVLPFRDIYLIGAALRVDMAAVEDLADLYSACPPPSDEGIDLDLSLIERSAISVVAQREQVRERLRHYNTMVHTDGHGNLAFTDDERRECLCLGDEESNFIGGLLLTQQSSPSNFWC